MSSLDKGGALNSNTPKNNTTSRMEDSLIMKKRLNMKNEMK